jgi:hypothetical protein
MWQNRGKVNKKTADFGGLEVLRGVDLNALRHQ